MSHQYNNSDPEGNVPEVECSCGFTVQLWSTLENECSKCGTKYNGSGQKIRDNWRKEAQRRGNLEPDPPVGRPGF